MSSSVLYKRNSPQMFYRAQSRMHEDRVPFFDKVDATMIPGTVRELAKKDYAIEMCDGTYYVSDASDAVIELIEDIEKAWRIADLHSIYYERERTTDFLTNRFILRLTLSVSDVTQREERAILDEIYRAYIRAFSLRRYDATGIESSEEIARVFKELMRIWSQKACSPYWSSSKFFFSHAVCAITTERVDFYKSRMAILSSCAEAMEHERFWEIEDAIDVYCDGVPIEDILA